jgi:hypothetical protein
MVFPRQVTLCVSDDFSRAGTGLIGDHQCLGLEREMKTTLGEG